jgi:hypothetical protein
MDTSKQPFISSDMRTAPSDMRSGTLVKFDPDPDHVLTLHIGSEWPFKALQLEPGHYRMTRVLMHHIR